MSLVLAGIAVADTIVVNDLVTGSDATKAPGTTGTIQVYLIAQNGAGGNATHPGDINGCNAGGGGQEVRVDLTSTDTSKVSVASPGYVLISTCDNAGTTNREGAATLGYSVASGATAGPVTINGVASGGKADSAFNNDGMTVTVHVAAPTKTTPSITWADPTAITYGTALGATQLNATASVAGTFAYTPTAGTVLTAGTHTVSVDFTPTDTSLYNAASKTVSLTVNKATAGMTLNGLSATYDGFAQPVTVTTNPTGLGTVSVTYDGFSTAPTDAGSYAVVATLTNANYQGSASGTLVIDKASADVELSDLAPTYDGSAKAATATTDPAGLNVVITYDGSAPAPTAAGSYAVVATVHESIYDGTASGTLTIRKAAATLELSDLEHTYDGSAKSATATTNPAGLSGVAITYDGDSAAPSGAGSYAVIATLTNANYEADEVRGTLLINKAGATVNLSDLTHTYDGDPKSASATTVPTGLVVDITYDNSSTAPSNAGSYEVVATVDDTNYEGSATSTLVINRAGQTITFDEFASAATYGDSALTLEATASSDLSVTFTVKSGPCAIVAGGNSLQINGAGSCVIEASQGGNTNYEPATSVSQTLTINKAAATLELSDLEHTYDGDPKSATATTNPAGLSGVAITYDGSATAPTDAGSYAVEATLTNDNYEAVPVTDTLVINKATATVTLSDLTHTYDGWAKSATVTTTPAGLSTVNITYDGSATAPTNAGSYAVVATLDNLNYEGTASANLLIRKATPVISWSAPSAIKVGTALGAAQLNATVDVPGTLAYNPPAGTVLAVGPHTLSVAFTPTDTANYNGATKNVSISVEYNFDGFFRPVDMGATLNVAKAGSAIPVKFTLGGDQGMNIFAVGFPKVVQITCSASAPADQLEELATASKSGLQYDSVSGQYTYVWKTDAKTMAGKCYRLEVKLNDGTATKVALFDLRK